MSKTAKEVADELHRTLYLERCRAIRADNSGRTHDKILACCKAWEDYSRALNDHGIYPALSGWRYRESAQK